MSSSTKATRPVALVTGASSGIGAAIAAALARRGYDLILTARREDRLRALAGELEEAHGVAAQVVAHDLGVPGGARALHARVAELGSPVELLVNNAGFGIYGHAWEQELVRVEAMLELNMTALTVLTQLFLPEMVARGRGRVLQVASIGAFQPSPLYAAYAATKAYVLNYSHAVNWELRQAGVDVRVTSLCPGLTRSEFHEVADHLKPPSVERLMMSAEAVAERGVKAALAGRAVVTPGWVNALGGFLVKLVPRSWATHTAGKMMQAKREA